MSVMCSVMFGKEVLSHILAPLYFAFDTRSFDLGGGTVVPSAPALLYLFPSFLFRKERKYARRESYIRARTEGKEHTRKDGYVYHIRTRQAGVRIFFFLLFFFSFFPPPPKASSMEKEEEGDEKKAKTPRNTLASRL